MLSWILICGILAWGGGVFHPLAREQDDLMASEPLGRGDEGLQFGDEGFTAREVRKTKSHAGHGIHGNSECLHPSQNPAGVGFRPILELTDQFYLVVSGLSDAFKVPLECPALVQRP